MCLFEMCSAVDVAEKQSHYNNMTSKMNVAIIRKWQVERGKTKWTAANKSNFKLKFLR